MPLTTAPAAQAPAKAPAKAPAAKAAAKAPAAKASKARRGDTRRRMIRALWANPPDGVASILQALPTPVNYGDAEHTAAELARLGGRQALMGLGHVLNGVAVADTFVSLSLPKDRFDDIHAKCDALRATLTPLLGELDDVVENESQGHRAADALGPAAAAADAVVPAAAAAAAE